MIIIFILGILLIFIFGYRLAEILLNKCDLVENISLSFILGIGLFTLIWFVLNLIGVSYSLLSGSILIIFLNIIVFCISKLILKHNFKIKISWRFNYLNKLNILEKTCLFLTVFFCLSSILQNIYWPVRTWDSIVMFDFRARLFAQTGFMHEAIERGYFFAYPLLTSLAHTWFYLLGGNNPSFIYGLFYTFFVFNFYVNLKKINISRLFVLLLTLLLAVAPRLFDHTQWAYTNLPFAVYLTLGSIYLYLGIKNKDLNSFIMSATLIGLSTWVRSVEPFWISSVIAVVIFSIILKKYVWPFIYIFILGLIMFPWRYFLQINKEGTVNVAKQVVDTTYSVLKDTQILKLVQTFNFIKTNVMYMYLTFFILIFLILIIKLIIKSKEWVFFIMILLNLMIIFGGTLSFALYFKEWQDIPDSLARMVMFIPPMVIFLAAELLSELKKS